MQKLYSSDFCKRDVEAVFKSSFFLLSDDGNRVCFFFFLAYFLCPIKVAILFHLSLLSMPFLVCFEHH